MNLRYDKINVPKYKYNVKNNLTISGNVVRYNVENRISDVTEIYAIVVDLREITNGIDFSNYNNMNEVLTDLPSSHDMETLMNTLPMVKLQVLSALGTGSLTLAFSTIIAMLVAQEYNIAVSGNLINLTELSQENMDYILSHVSIDRFASHRIEFLFIANGMIISILDAKDFPDRFKITSDNVSTSGSIPQILNSRYNTTDITLLHTYSSEAITGQLLNTELPLLVYGKGSLTPYVTIKQNSDYNIDIDGYYNDYGTFSDVKHVIIKSSIDSSIIDPTEDNPAKILTLPFTSDFKLNDKYIFEVRNLMPLPISAHLYYDEATMKYTTITCGENTIYWPFNGMTTTINERTFINVTSLVGYELQLSGKNNVTVEIQQYNALSDMPNYSGDPTNQEFEDRENFNSYLRLQYDKIGKKLESYVDPEYIHVGSHNYMIPTDGSTSLVINYYNYDNPPVNIVTAVKSGLTDSEGNALANIDIFGMGTAGGGDAGSGECLIAGTKITMADGSLKNIEDIEIGEYILDDEGNAQKVIWNLPHNHRMADHYTYYNFPDGREIGIITDERILWNGKYQFISTIPELSKTDVYIESKPYELWTTGKDVIIANGVVCAKIYSGVKNKFIRNILRHMYKFVFLNKKDYKFIDWLHNFVGTKILGHKK